METLSGCENGVEPTPKGSSAITLQAFTGQDLRLHHKLLYIQKYSEVLLDNPNLKQDEICKITGIKKHTLRRYMKELGITSFYKHDLTISRKYQKASINTKKLQSKDPKRVDYTLEAAKECNRLQRSPKNNISQSSPRRVPSMVGYAPIPRGSNKGGQKVINPDSEVLIHTESDNYEVESTPWGSFTKADLDRGKALVNDNPFMNRITLMDKKRRRINRDINEQSKH